MRVRPRKAGKRRMHHTQQGEVQKQRLVDAAYDIIAEQGFEGLRTREVALRADLNISTLHYYFASKEDLVRSVAERLLSEFKAIPDPPRAAVDAMTKLGREFSEQAEVIRTRPATYVVVMELFTRSLRDSRLAPVVKELLFRWERHFGSLVEEGARGGQIATGADTLATTRALQCLLLGRALILLLKGDDPASKSMFRQVSRWLSADGINAPDRRGADRRGAADKAAPRALNGDR